jgi:hypothetical protein
MPQCVIGARRPTGQALPQVKPAQPPRANTLVPLWVSIIARALMYIYSCIIMYIRNLP